MLSKEDDKNVELTERINADLRAKMSESVLSDAQADPDYVEDSAYAEGFKKTGRYAWVFIILGVVAVIGLIIFGISKH